jgi:uncharacterized protein GlcG (DUF336 family)
MMKVAMIDVSEAERVIAAAAAEAERIGVPQNIAVVDAAGHLVAFRRIDGAKFLSIEIAIAKAVTAANVGKHTADILPATLPGQPGFGLQHFNDGRFTTLGGGFPILAGDVVIGAIGVSSGTVAEDVAVARAATDSFEPSE